MEVPHRYDYNYSLSFELYLYFHDSTIYLLTLIEIDYKWNFTIRHLQIERAYVDIGPFKKIYQREYLWNHTYHIPKY